MIKLNDLNVDDEKDRLILGMIADLQGGVIKYKGMGSELILLKCQQLDDFVYSIFKILTE